MGGTAPRAPGAGSLSLLLDEGAIPSSRELAVAPAEGLKGLASRLFLGRSPVSSDEPPVVAAAARADLDETAALKDLRRAVREGKAGALPADAAKYKYLLVPGFLWDAVEGYFEPNRDRLRKLGLDADILETDPLGTPQDNAKLLKKAVQASDKPVILLAHSKGGIDSLAFLDHEWRLRDKVRALVAIQTPYFGTPVADFFLSRPLLRTTALAYARLLNPWRLLSVNPFFRGRTIQSLSKAQRGELSRSSLKRDLKTALYSVVSRVDDATALKLLLWISAGTVKTLTGLHNDGIVSPEDGVIPGSTSALLEHVGHIDTISEPSRWKHKALGVRGHDPTFAADLTEAIVRWVLGGSGAGSIPGQ